MILAVTRAITPSHSVTFARHSSFQAGSHDCFTGISTKENFVCSLFNCSRSRSCDLISLSAKLIKTLFVEAINYLPQVLLLPAPKYTLELASPHYSLNQR